MATIVLCWAPKSSILGNESCFLSVFEPCILLYSLSKRFDSIMRYFMRLYMQLCKKFEIAQCYVPPHNVAKKVETSSTFAMSHATNHTVHGQYCTGDYIMRSSFRDVTINVMKIASCVRALSIGLNKTELFPFFGFVLDFDSS